jgi:eukaryotic-like serine/threonine-protein kinase
MYGLDYARRRIGEVIDGRYELREVLGAGTSGAVYRALHKFTHREVAVKVLHQQLISDKDAVARFLREARTVTGIGHPSIVEVIDAGATTDSLPYVVLQLLKGRSLMDAVLERPLADADVIAIGIDLCDGLAAAHSHNIVHRDIKPDNVFLLDDPPPRLKILDFGVAKNLQSGSASVLTKPGATIGTPSYMSPEQARAGQIDARTDLFSAGAVLFFAATGRPPFNDDSVPAVLMKLVTSRAPSLASIRADADPTLCQVVDRALEPDRDKRWPSAAIMSAVLRGNLKV